MFKNKNNGQKHSSDLTKISESGDVPADSLRALTQNESAGTSPDSQISVLAYWECMLYNNRDRKNEEAEFG